MKTSLLAAALLLAMAACNSQSPPPAAPAPEASTGTPDAGAPTAPTTAPDAMSANAPGAINEPIPQADVDVRMALSGVPKYDATRDLLLFDIDVTNGGRVAIASKGTKPVRLGAMLAGPDGVDKAPGKRDFKRLDLPEITPGANAIIHAQVPVKPLLSLALQVDAVQERVAWFGRAYGKPVLDIGTFKRCAAEGMTLCDQTGQAVPDAGAK